MTTASHEWEDQPLFEHEATAGPKVKKRPGSRTNEPREFGIWTLDKLTILEKYFKMYRKVAGSGTYIDAFAGEGLALIDKVNVPGSPIRALDSGSFRSLKFVEMDRRKAAALRIAVAANRNAGKCEVIEGDANVDVGRPCFAFLDPDSTQLNWSTVVALAAYKQLNEEAKSCKIELWILFNEHQAIRRLWPRDKRNLPAHAHVLDRVMGERDAWIDLWDEKHGASWLVHRYVERLRRLGYVHVHMQQISDPSTGRAQYWMVHASDHDAAASLMRWAKRSSSISYNKETLPGLGLNDR
jgi:three-Cys-motif partner protein